MLILKPSVFTARYHVRETRMLAQGQRQRLRETGQKAVELASTRGQYMVAYVHVDSQGGHAEHWAVDVDQPM